MLATNDAALVIGDRALDIDAAALGATKIDLGVAWKEMTGLPFVYAVWAGRPDALDHEQVHRRQAAYGEFIMSSFYQPRPRPGFLIDTSSSMQETQLARAVAELGGLTRQLGYSTEVVVACCDAAVHGVRKVFTAAQLGWSAAAAQTWSWPPLVHRAQERPNRPPCHRHRLRDTMA